MKHLMIDLETLGTKPGCEIVQMACVFFSPSSIEEGFHCTIDFSRHTQYMPKLDIDRKTLLWWLEKAGTSPFPESWPKLSRSAASWKLHSVLKDKQDIFLWAKSPSFDCEILRVWLEKVAEVSPDILPPYYKWRDVRTIQDYVDYKAIPFEGQPHNALDDAKHQIKVVQAAWKALGTLPESYI